MSAKDRIAIKLKITILIVANLGLVMMLPASHHFLDTAEAMPVQRESRPSQELFLLINTVRQDAGLRPLQLSTNLSQAAQEHTWDMVNKNRISHQGSDDSSPGDRAKRMGYLSDYIGENITAGRKTAQETINGWLKNSVYRANLFDTNYDDVGFGYIYQPQSHYQYYWVAVFGSENNTNPNTKPLPNRSDLRDKCRGQQWLTQTVCPNDDLNEEEAKLYRLINQYRTRQQLPKIPHSDALNQVANRHVHDLEENAALYNHNGEDWRFGWSNCAYDGSSPQTFSCLWNAPQRLKTNYQSIAHEIICGGEGDITAEEAFKCWQNSPANLELITNQGIWRNYLWQAIGVGLYKGYAVLWFGEEPDQVNIPKKNPLEIPNSPPPKGGKIW